MRSSQSFGCISHSDGKGCSLDNPSATTLHPPGMWDAVIVMFLAFISSRNSPIALVTDLHRGQFVNKLNFKTNYLER